jgi:hypothetical protein
LRSNNSVIESETIEILAVSELAESLAHETIDFIKIDSQGSEMDIIKGGLEMCKQSKIFLLEASVYPYNLNAPMFDELKEFMGSIGFGYNKIVSDIYHPNDGNLLIQHDVLFSKIELL